MSPRTSQEPGVGGCPDSGGGDVLCPRPHPDPQPQIPGAGTAAVSRGPGPEQGPQQPGGVCLQRGHAQGTAWPQDCLCPLVGFPGALAPLAGRTPGTLPLDARKGMGSALRSGSQGTLKWTPPPLTLTAYCPWGTLRPRRTPGNRSMSPPGRQEGPQQVHHPRLSAPPASLSFAEPVGSATREAPPKGAHFSGGIFRGEGSSSGLKGHLSL